VLILKGVEVVCLDTLLQVLILKVDAGGLRIAPGCPGRGMPPPAFCKKRLQAIENKERRSEKERQEISRGGKLLKERGLEEKRTNGLVRFVRDNTAQGITDLDVCQ